MVRRNSEGDPNVPGVGNQAAKPRPAQDLLDDDDLKVSVVICAHTEMRWNQTRAAVSSVLRQHPRPTQVLLVVDHNGELAARARRELSGVSVIENDGSPGLSDARNTGLRAATEPITAFLDDDAEARPGWLSTLVEPYSDPAVLGTGGSVHARWPGHRPAWLPPTFEWVVGCSYLGLPETVAQVRNPIGANMSLRTQPALEVGGFNASLGRSASGPRGCEETELAIRLTASRPNSVILYVPSSGVDHHVGKERLRLRYFLRRCWHEGISKAAVVLLAGSTAGLARERRHVAEVIPATLLLDLRRLVGGDSAALMRITVAAVGLATTTAGYLTGWASQGGRRRIRSEVELRRSATSRPST